MNWLIDDSRLEENIWKYSLMSNLGVHWKLISQIVERHGKRTLGRREYKKKALRKELENRRFERPWAWVRDRLCMFTSSCWTFDADETKRLRLKTFVLRCSAEIHSLSSVDLCGNAREVDNQSVPTLIHVQRRSCLPAACTAKSAFRLSRDRSMAFIHKCVISKSAFRLSRDRSVASKILGIFAIKCHAFTKKNTRARTIAANFHFLGQLLQIFVSILFVGGNFFAGKFSRGIFRARRKMLLHFFRSDFFRGNFFPREFFPREFFPREFFPRDFCSRPYVPHLSPLTSL